MMYDDCVQPASLLAFGLPAIAGIAAGDASSIAATPCGVGRLRACYDTAAHRGGGLVIGLVVEHGGEFYAHVVLDVVGEHAQEHMSAHARRRPVEDRAQMDVDGLQRTEGALDAREALVGAGGCGPPS